MAESNNATDVKPTELAANEAQVLPTKKEPSVDDSNTKRIRRLTLKLGEIERER